MKKSARSVVDIAARELKGVTGGDPLRHWHSQSAGITEHPKWPLNPHRRSRDVSSKS